MEVAEAIKPGIYYGMPSEQYHAIDAISATRLMKLYVSTPAHVKFGEREATAAMETGSAMHCMLLEPEKWNERYYDMLELDGKVRTKKGEIAKNPEQTEEGKRLLALHAAENEGKTAVLAKDRRVMEEIREACLVHPIVSQLLNDSKREVSLFWEEQNIGLCKARFDMLGQHFIADLKTVNRPYNANPQAFSWRIVPTRDGLNYWVQASWYWHAAKMLKLTIKEFYFAAVEMEKPYGISVHVLEDAELAEGAEKVYGMAMRWAECVRTGHYPAYPCIKNVLTLGGDDE